MIVFSNIEKTSYYWYKVNDEINNFNIDYLFEVLQIVLKIIYSISNLTQIYDSRSRKKNFSDTVFKDTVVLYFFLL